jgi:2-polyprenyl-6-methoxyphenol hydroxylase-like FAD-dependent oxidoreductase
MTYHEVVIVGGGPTGMMLAGELALAGIDVAIVERRADQELVGSRSSGLHARTVEILDQRGIAERFISQGKKYPVVNFHGALDIGDFPTRHNYTLGLWQNRIEKTMSGWIAELPVTVYRQRDVTGFTQDEAGVEIALSDGSPLRAEYLVGCDGGRSLVRKTAGIEFSGCDPAASWIIAQAEFSEDPKWGFHNDARGIHAIGKVEDSTLAGIVLAESPMQLGDTPSLHEVKDALVAIYGTDYGIHSPASISRFTDMARQAVAYRDRRVLLAGDAAHVQSPTADRVSIWECKMRSIWDGSLPRS